jgi:REP element-mobilizing transposase RayT
MEKSQIYNSCPNFMFDCDLLIVNPTTFHFKKYPEIKKQLWGGHFWSERGYIGTVGDGVTADIIKDYVEKQGTDEEKEGFSQMKLLDFE